MKKFYYMDNVMRQMFPAQIAAEIKKLLQCVGVDENMLNQDTSVKLTPTKDSL